MTKGKKLLIVSCVVTLLWAVGLKINSAAEAGSLVETLAGLMAIAALILSVVVMTMGHAWGTALRIVMWPWRALNIIGIVVIPFSALFVLLLFYFCPVVLLLFAGVAKQ